MPGLFPFIAGLIAYAVTLVLTQRVLAGGIDSPVARILLALAPMLPAAFVCGVIVRGIRQMDEMQRKLQFEALALSFAGTALITFGYGFLEGTGFPKLSMFVVWPLMAALWFVGVMVGRLRFR